MGWPGDDPGQNLTKQLVSVGQRIQRGQGPISQLQLCRLHLRVFPMEVPEENQCGQLRGLWFVLEHWTYHITGKMHTR